MMIIREDDIYTGDCMTDKVLMNGSYMDIKYCIKTLGSHPCCYVKVPFEMIRNGLDTDELLVHGGITYGCGRVIGWDYAHYGDYMKWSDSHETPGRIYNIRDLINDCESVIRQIREMME